MIVLDTCAVLWLASDPSRLSKAAAASIQAERKNGGLAISGITLPELAWSVTRKRVSISIPLAAFLAEIAAHFIVLPITASIAQIAVELPSAYPNDPMDRIIGATALDCGASLVTADRAIRRSNAVAVIW